jgi:hypothetical protein
VGPRGGGEKGRVRSCSLSPRAARPSYCGMIIRASTHAAHRRFDPHAARPEPIRMPAYIRCTRTVDTTAT